MAASTVSTSGSAAFNFPPLPPLPTPTSDSGRAGVPASYSQTVGVRSRRCRVSFRDDVNIGRAGARATISTSRPSSGPPAAPSSSGPLPANSESEQPRRSSTDNFQMFKAQLAPRPVLKRAHSSQALKADRSHEVWDAFRPQTLRYPKVSPALARLSDGSIPATPLWLPSASIASVGSTGSVRSRKSAQYCSSPTAIASPTSPAASHSATAAVLTGSATTATSTPGNAPPGRKARTPRSPIPSWSSAATTCPSLVSSSHRASLASTLTAPSMTSLLLSPPSPSDRYGIMPPSPAFIDDAILHTPHYARAIRDAGDDSDYDNGGGGPIHGHYVKPRRSVGGGGGPACSETDMPAPSAWTERGDRVFGGEKPPSSRLYTTTRFRSRRSDPVSASPCDNSPLLSPPPPLPRATERLLKLQSSLADLRMQRRAEEDKQAAAIRARARANAGPRSDTSASVSGSGTSTGNGNEPSRQARPNSPPVSRPRPRAPSPTLGDLIRKGARDDLHSTEFLDNDSDDESDLDLSLPPLNAALRSHVIPSSSRLLVSSGSRSTSSMAEVPDPLGWSGSDSEEEEFSRTVARIARRKTQLPTSRQVLKRPSFTTTRMSRYSDFGPSTTTMRDVPPSPSTVSDPTTPNVDAIDGRMSMASRRSTASSVTSAHATGTAALINALVEQKYATQESLPRPKRFVEGWGAPEVLHDDEWPPDNGGHLETLSEVW